MHRIHRPVACVGAALACACALAGCHAKQTAAPPTITPKSSFESQIDGNPNMTPEQKAAAKQQVQQLPTPTPRPAGQ